MAKQLVLSGNRILAHGEDCFLSMGGTVICTQTGRTFSNATVANVTGGIPADIDSVGYEYHAGEFVPCAPFGKGGGNIAVCCPDDCKSIKDSGKSAEHLANVAVIDYVGTGTTSVTITADFEPLFAVVYDTDEYTLEHPYNKRVAVITPNGGVMYDISDPKTNADLGTITPFYLFSSTEGNSMSWNCPFVHSSKETIAMNAKNYTYRAFVVGRA